MSRQRRENPLARKVTPVWRVSGSECRRAFPLPWSAYVRLLSVTSEQARKFYEMEALRGGWSVRQLDRQINALFYERTALSRSKAKMLTKGAAAKHEDAITPEEESKDPYVLEFLGLKDEYSESDIEEALVLHLERFLLDSAAILLLSDASAASASATNGIGSICCSFIASCGASW